MPRRTYDQYCAIARALDVVGERWSLLIVRELLAGPRRYTDLHADLPGVSTDVLAARLKELERDGVLERRRLPPPAAAQVYELTGRGRALSPVLSALSGWGEAARGERRPTDAWRAHWFAIPLMRRLAEAGHPGVAEIRLDGTTFHVCIDASGDTHADGPPGRAADAVLTLDSATAEAVSGGAVSLAEAVKEGRAVLAGDSAFADALRSC